MSMIRANTLSSPRDPRLRELSMALLGDSVVAVEYGMLSTTEETAELQRDIHEVDMSVRLRLASGAVLELSWGTPGVEEGMVISLPADANAEQGEACQIDAGSAPGWDLAVGAPIEGVGIAFLKHFGPWGDPDVRPWAFRLEFRGGLSAVVALGELDGRAQPSFFPNNLVVMFDARVADNYRVIDGINSSWGIDF